MACERDRVLNVIEFLKTLNIDVNVAKNKARGHKGFFAAKGGLYRIDITKGLDEQAVLRTLAHEFAHYVHYCNDNTLESLTAILGEVNDDMMEEMLAITVHSVSKTSVKPLFTQVELLKSEIKDLKNQLSVLLRNSTDKVVDFKSLESLIEKKEYKYLLKYDRVKVLRGFSFKYYAINTLEVEDKIKIYLILKSKQRFLKRIMSKINKLNKYYNQPSELWARSFETYLMEKNFFAQKAPLLFARLEYLLKVNENSILSNYVKIYFN